jgi:hypothetical protein
MTGAGRNPGADFDADIYSDGVATSWLICDLMQNENDRNFAARTNGLPRERLSILRQVLALYGRFA